MRMLQRNLLLLLSLCVSACAAPMAQREAALPVRVGVIAINDFHGTLEPPGQAVLIPDGKGDVIAVPAGGAAWLASAIDSIRTKYPHHLTVSAGDLIGGTPFNSALFLDEPAIGVMNRIGLDFNAVGNHEFDRGLKELDRMQRGGCERHTAQQPCQIERYTGASFPFLAANTLRKDGTTLFPPTALRSFGKGRGQVKVGLIGLTLKGTAALSPPEVGAEVSFADEADTANALVADLKAQGADAIILLIHQGGRTGGIPDPDACEGLGDAIRPVLDRLDPRIDVVVSGHSHWAYVCDYAQYNPARPFLLTSAGLWGKLVTDIAIDIDPVTRKVVAKRADNVIVQSTGYIGAQGRVEPVGDVPQFTPRADIAAYVGRYVDAAGTYARRKVGRISAPIEKIDGPLSNTGGPLGNLIADAQLAATRGAGAEIALMNPFGIRRSLPAAPDGSVTYGDLYAVQPFRNQLITLTLSGAALKAVLEEGFDTLGPQQVLTPSEGFAFSYDRSRPVGERIAAMTLNGSPIDPARGYRVTVSQFLADGGDDFASFRKGHGRTTGMLDLDALEAWIKAVPVRTAPPQPRTTDLRPELNPNQRKAPPGQKY